MITEYGKRISHLKDTLRVLRRQYKDEKEMLKGCKTSRQIFIVARMHSWVAEQIKTLSWALKKIERKR